VTFSRADAAVLLALLAAVGALVSLAPRLRIPYPILLVVGGLALGFVPGIPHVELPPDLVLIAFLPPLLYISAFFTSLRDLRTNMRPIALLSVGAVVATLAGVAVVAHAVVGLAWAPAFVLGAAVSATDPVSATAIARRTGLPRRLIVIVEGESLVNDGTALVAYRFAVVAVVTGAFSIGDVGLTFAKSVIGGIAVGLAVGYVMRIVRRDLHDPQAEITMSFLTGYVAFLPAYALGVSGVLAVVAAGVYMGWHAPELTTPDVRLQSTGAWQTATFVLNATLFVLVGLQLRPILDSLSDVSTARLIGDAAAVSAAVIVLRFLWIYLAAYVPRALFPKIRARDPYPPWQYPTVIGWMGMRGAVTLAAALGIPLTVNGGGPFPDRQLIIFLAFAVILVTLVLQGLTLPGLIRILGLEDDGLDDKEEAKARIRAADAALDRLHELERESWVREDTAERMAGLYRFRKTRYRARFDDEDDGAIESRSADYQRLRRELLEAERAAVVSLRQQGRISDDVMHRIERDLDLEDSRLDY
jgi:CPA1 family monovalent cation:H+ antiporter